MTSQARIDANRRNAQKSTGPRTAEGKARSRLNGLVHGLRSDEVVLPTEDPAAFASHLAAWMDDWSPPTETRRFLVERAATAAWRIKRCVRAETLRVARRIDEARNEWDTLRDAQIDRAVANLADHFESATAYLHSSRAGVDRLLGLWSDLAGALDRPDGWDDPALHDSLLDLIGVGAQNPIDDLQTIDTASWRLLLRAQPDLAAGDDAPHDDESVPAVVALLAGICRVHLDGLAEIREALPEALPARDRFAEWKAFEPRPEDQTLGRYEARLDREARSAIAQLIRLETTGADLSAVTDDDPPVPSVTTEPKPDVPAPVEPSPAEPITTDATTEPNPQVAIVSVPWSAPAGDSPATEAQGQVRRTPNLALLC